MQGVTVQWTVTRGGAPANGNLVAENEQPKTEKTKQNKNSNSLRYPPR